MKHPMQAIVYDEHRTARFVSNPIVNYLLEKGPFDMNQLSRKFGGEVHREDQMQFAQLIGYSVSGFGGLPYADEATIAMADKIVEKLTTPEESVIAAARSAVFELERLRDYHNENFANVTGTVDEAILNTLNAAIKELDDDE